jgi:hypothetical protein
MAIAISVMPTGRQRRLLHRSADGVEARPHVLGDIRRAVQGQGDDGGDDLPSEVEQYATEALRQQPRRDVVDEEELDQDRDVAEQLHIGRGERPHDRCGRLAREADQDPE